MVAGVADDKFVGKPDKLTNLAWPTRLRTDFLGISKVIDHRQLRRIRPGVCEPLGHRFIERNDAIRAAIQKPRKLPQAQIRCRARIHKPHRWQQVGIDILDPQDQLGSVELFRQSQARRRAEVSSAKPPHRVAANGAAAAFCETKLPIARAANQLVEPLTQGRCRTIGRGASSTGTRTM